MLSLTRKIETDANGNAKKILIPWTDFRKTSKLLGIDSDDKSLSVFRESRSSRGPINIGISAAWD